jgi:hypothetical protein
MNIDQKLEKFAEHEFRKNLPHIIFDDDEGGWIAFGKYRIRPVEDGFVVETTTINYVGTFGSKRTAISWCVADRFDQLNLANEILILDSKKRLTTADIQTRQAVARKSRTQGFSEMIETKIQPKIDVLKSVSAELEKCVNSAKYLQLRGFSNETARTSRA